MERYNIKISVIMPIYNSGEYLKTAVDSILNQSLKEFELILIDDGSTDGSAERCDEYASRDSRVVVIHQKNSGICKARNVALKIAKGEYIAFSDHDDEYLPGLLENAYATAIHDSADMVKFCKIERVVLNSSIIREKRTFLENAIYKGEEIKQSFFRLLNNRVFECVWDGIFKKALLINNHIEFDTAYKMGGEDVDFIIKVLTKAKSLSTMKSSYYLHYVRIGFSTSSKFDVLKIDTTRYLACRITEECRKMGIDISNYKKEYVYHMMYLYINSITNMLANPLCVMKKTEKIQTLKDLLNEPFIPSWFLKVSIKSILRQDKRCGISYFLYKHGYYSILLILFRLRQKQLRIKA